jgi:hypothetical protein
MIARNGKIYVQRSGKKVVQSPQPLRILSR